MTAVLAKVFIAVATNFFNAFFTEKLISKLIVEMLSMLAAKTTNTIDDEMVREIAENLNIS